VRRRRPGGRRPVRGLQLDVGHPTGAPHLGWLDAAAVTACGGLVVLLAARLTGLTALDALLLLPAALAGYLLADLASGLVHWFFDRFLDEAAPVIGPALVRPFREHHRDPRAMTRHGVLELTGNSCLGLLPLLAAAVWLGPGAGPAAAVAYGTLLSFALAVVATNVAHAWAHAATVPAPVAWLQRRRLILPPDAHAAHHGPAADRAYCVTTGWANALTDGLGVFRRLERALLRLGVPPALDA